MVDGRPLTDQEAWWHEFGDELRQQCDGEVDGDWLVEISNALFRRSSNENPRRMARLAFAIFLFDPLMSDEHEDVPRASGLHLPENVESGRQGT